RVRLAHLAFGTPSKEQRPVWRKQFDELGAQRDGLEADLAAQSAAYRRTQQARQSGPDELVAALPDGVALVDFLAYTHFTNPRNGKRPIREARLLAFVVRPGRPVALVPLGEESSVDGAVVIWRRALQERQPDALRKAAAELGRRVWDPLRPHLAGVHTVLV